MTPADLPAHMATKVTVDEHGCWLWTAAIQTRGYGSVSIPGTGRTALAHRVAYEHLASPIPIGLTIDHLCRVKRCVNPEHLEPVSIQTNVRRALGLITHCPQGHPYSGHNLKVTAGGSRNCRTCLNAKARERRAAKAVAA